MSSIRVHKCSSLCQELSFIYQDSPELGIYQVHGFSFQIFQLFFLQFPVLVIPFSSFRILPQNILKTYRLHSTASSRAKSLLARSRLMRSSGLSVSATFLDRLGTNTISS